jgi:ACS family hexuronate transporter-like MFS transporter
MATQEATLPLEQLTPASSKIGNFRWVICALIFLGTTLNYADRQILSLLAPDIQAKYHINDAQFGKIVASFSFCYAVGQLFAGGWLDRVGTRVGYTIAVATWSVASMLHALATSALGFGMARGLLGITESPAYPSATKILAEWMPRRERALGMGIVNAGSNLGALLVPALIPMIVLHFGLNAAFLLTGGSGVLFLLLWIPLYRRPQEHKRLSASELAHIQSDPAEPTTRVPWASLFSYPQTWAFVASKFITDSIWAFFIFFSAKFLNKRFGLDLKHIGPPVVVIYMLADVGSIGGGWVSSHFLRRGWTVNRARKTAMLLCALCVLPVGIVTIVPGLWTAVFLIGLAMAAHQGFSANQYTLCSDLFPRRAVGSVAGMGGSAGYFGATILSVFTGYLLQWSGGNYTVPFVIAALAYLAAFGVIQLLAPHLEPAKIDDQGHGFPVIPAR